MVGLAVLLTTLGFKDASVWGLHCSFSLPAAILLCCADAICKEVWETLLLPVFPPSRWHQ